MNDQIKPRGKGFARNVVAFVVGVAIIVVGIEVLSYIWWWIFQIDVVVSALVRFDIVFIVVYFLISLAIYGAPYRLAIGVSVLIGRGAVTGIVLSVLYIALLVWSLIYSMGDESFRYAMYAMAACIVSAGYKIFTLATLHAALKEEAI